MLTQLQLSGFGVIDSVELEFGPGLTALTGETGAGKTMVVTGLEMLLGERGDAGIVRRGSKKAQVEGRWLVGETLAQQVEELGGDLDEELVTLRQISAQGRSRASAGGVPVPVSRLAGITAELATIHGQSEQLRLSTLERQREVLDGFARPKDLTQYRELYRQHHEMARELSDLRHQAQARARQIDMLRFGLDEIDAVDPQPGEDEQLTQEASRLQDAEELKGRATGIMGVLSGHEHDFDAPNVVAMLGEVRKSMAALAQRDPVAQSLSDRVEEANLLVNDLAGDVAAYEADLVSDPLRLEAVVERRAALASLTRKYGPGISDVLQWAENARRELGSLEDADGRIELLSSRIDELDRQLEELSATVTRDRSAAAEQLEVAVREELAALAMPHARLQFALTPVERGPHGSDRVELLFAANPGASAAPLGKVASGGELSRVRLALEVILAADSSDHTFVFDEVDAGVGGAVGLEIGRRLQRLARTTQVIVVTHLAQVAAFADDHFVVTKQDDGQVTTSGIHKLPQNERSAELARMMSGTHDSDAGERHAAELLELGQAARDSG